MSIKPIFLVLIIAASSLSGCIAGEQRIDDDGVIVPESIKIAFSIKDDYSNFDENPYNVSTLTLSLKCGLDASKILQLVIASS